MAADAAICYPGPNLAYLTGFRGEPEDRYVLLVVEPDGATLVTPEQYVGQVRRASDLADLVTVSGNDPRAVAEAAADLLDAPDRVLLDDHLRWVVGRHLDAALGDVEWGTLAELLGEPRLRKAASELGALRRAAGVADAVSEEIRALGSDAVGLTESELATEIRGRLFARGAQRLSFDVVVGSGPNGARPYTRHGDREIRAGEPVVLDFGAFVDGYASDQTRTVVFAGDPPEGFRDVHDAALAALDAGVDAVGPGVPLSDVDRAVRDTVAERGYADDLVHGTGHGVGLEAHEPPTVGPESDLVLEPGTVFSVEPGIYPGPYGVRVEDLVAVTEDGPERLNDSPRTWRPL